MCENINLFFWKNFSIESMLLFGHGRQLWHLQVTISSPKTHLNLALVSLVISTIQAYFMFRVFFYLHPLSYFYLSEFSQLFLTAGGSWIPYMNICIWFTRQRHSLFSYPILTLNTYAVCFLLKSQAGTQCWLSLSNFQVSLTFLVSTGQISTLTQ